MKYIKPLKIEKVFKDISEHLYDDIFEKMDRKLFRDRMKFIEKSIYWDEYKSTDEFDKSNIYDTDIRSVSELIGQIVVFGRIIRENGKGDYNLPKGEVPLYLRQIDENGKENDMINLSSGKVLKRIYKKKKFKGKLEELNSFE